METTVNYHFVPERKSDQDPRFQPVLDVIGSELFIHSDLGIMFVDGLAHNIYVNPALTKLLDASISATESVLSDIISELLGLKDEMFCSEMVAELLGDEARIHEGIEYSSTDGVKYDFDIKTLPKIGVGGRKIGTVIIIKDNSVVKELESQIILLQKSENTSEMFSGIIHNHRNLLTIISGNLEFALTHKVENSALKEQLQTVLSVTNSACSQANNYLQFIKHRPALKSTFDLNELVISVQKMFGSILDKRIKLSFDSYSEPCWIHGFSDHFEQLIVNLIINAQDAIEHSGNIRITTQTVPVSTIKYSPLDDEEGESCIMLTVSDSGCGMTAEVKDKLFDPFFSTKGKGTGLGLAMVSKVINRSNGFVKVDSEVGRGTTFSIFLPQDRDVESVSHTHSRDSYVRC